MKELPSEKKLLEVLELCRVAEEQARKLHDMGQEMSARWRMIREASLAAQHQEGEAKNVSADRELIICDRSNPVDY